MRVTQTKRYARGLDFFIDFFCRSSLFSLPLPLLVCLFIAHSFHFLFWSWLFNKLRWASEIRQCQNRFLDVDFSRFFLHLKASIGLATLTKYLNI